MSDELPVVTTFQVALPRCRQLLPRTPALERKLEEANGFLLLLPRGRKVGTLVRFDEFTDGPWPFGPSAQVVGVARATITRTRRGWGRYASWAENAPSAEARALGRVLRKQMTALLQALPTDDSRLTHDRCLKIRNLHARVDALIDTLEMGAYLIEEPTLEGRLRLLLQCLPAAYLPPSPPSRRVVADRRPESLRGAKQIRWSKLELWTFRLPGTQIARLPDPSVRTNPAVDGDRLVLSLFSPGQVCALSRDGKLLWNQPLSPFGGHPPVLIAGLVLVHTAFGLSAFQAESGEPVWRWRPVAGPGEHTYSSPAIGGGAAFLGDRRGRMHAVELATGRPRWSVAVTGGQDVNASPLVVRDRVIGAANDHCAFACAFACSLQDGRILWRTLLDGPSIWEVMLVDGYALCSTPTSLYWLCTETGTVRYQWSSPAQLSRYTACDDVILVVATGKPMSPSRVVAVSKGEVLYEFETHAFPDYGWSAETGLAYESSLEGITLLDPRTGERFLDIRFTEEALLAGPACVHEGVIYQFTVSGTLHALRHPEARG